MKEISTLPEDKPLKIIIGAGEQSYPGWIATHKEDLDLTDETTWEKVLGTRRVDALLCEHVWEHLSETQGREAAKICFKYLKPGGYLRCAVPDGNFPDPKYQKVVGVGGPGPKDHPAADHKVIYTCGLFVDVFASAGFEVKLLEYCDETGQFHYQEWSPEYGMIYRSMRFDHRNQAGSLKFVSLIIDAKKSLNKSIV